MAQGTGLQIFPILYRTMTFDKLPSGLKYMLASTNCINFDRRETDDESMVQLLADVRTTFSMQPVKQQMRHSSKPAAEGDQPAEIPLAAPELPPHVVERPEIMEMLRSHLLPPAAQTGQKVSNRSRKVSAHGQGGVGKVSDKPHGHYLSLMMLFTPRLLDDDGSHGAYDLCV